MVYRLEELFDLQMGKTPSRNNNDYWRNEGNKWISISDLSQCGKYISMTKERISDRAVEETGIREIPANTVIMSFKLTIGKTAITSEPMYSNEAIMAFHDKHIVKLIPDYIYYMFSGKDWNEGTNKAVLGKTLNKATISKVKIDVCDIDKQRSIVDILDKVSAIIENRKKELKMMDELIKARFVEMFGDPVLNSRQHTVRKLDDLGELNRGVSKARPRNSPDLLGGPYPLIQTGEVAAAQLYIDSYENTYSEKGLAQSRIWPKGTLCITIAANIAQTAILAIDACFPDSVVGFIPGDEVTQMYMHYWFGFFQKILDEQAPQVAQKNINLNILSNLDVMVPPLKLQKQFENFVTQTDKSKLMEWSGRDVFLAVG